MNYLNNGNLIYQPLLTALKTKTCFRPPRMLRTTMFWYQAVRGFGWSRQPVRCLPPTAISPQRQQASLPTQPTCAAKQRTTLPVPQQPPTSPPSHSRQNSLLAELVVTAASGSRDTDVGETSPISEYWPFPSRSGRWRCCSSVRHRKYHSFRAGARLLAISALGRRGKALYASRGTAAAKKSTAWNGRAHSLEDAA